MDVTSPANSRYVIVLRKVCTLTESLAQQVAVVIAFYIILSGPQGNPVNEIACFSPYLSDNENQMLLEHFDDEFLLIE